jgi:cell division protein FtsW
VSPGGKGVLARGPKQRRGAPPIEYSLLLTATMCLIALGAVMVFSASSAKALLAEGGGDGAEYLKRTVVFAAIGLLVMRVASVRGVRIARAATPLLLAASAVFLAAVLVPGVGQTVNGAQRWIGAGLLQFQPSEIAKVAIVLYGAHLLATEPRRARTLGGLAPLLLVLGLCLALIARQPDLGTSMVVVFGVGCMLLTAGVRPRTLAPVAGAVALVAIAMIASHPYQQERLTGFIDASGDPNGAGYQSRQATIAVGSGGLFGAGLGESVQKASYLPEAHTDMIAAVIGEEMGLAGMGVLIALFGMFGYAGFRAAHRARDRYSKLLCAGLTSLIMAQAAINLFAVLGLAPLTGVPLPFVSYGGTSLVVTMAATGLILDVARGRGAADAGAVPAASGGRTAAAPARLRLLKGSGDIRTRARDDKSRDSGRRHRGPRRAGDRRRRRAAR